jgi:hypothetical protein
VISINSRNASDKIPSVQTTDLTEHIIDLIREGEDGPIDPQRWRADSVIVLEQVVGPDHTIAQESKRASDRDLMFLLEEALDVVESNSELSEPVTTNMSGPTHLSDVAHWLKLNVMKEVIAIVLAALIIGIFTDVPKWVIGLFRQGEKDSSYVRLGVFSGGGEFFLFEEAGSSDAKFYSAVRIVQVSNHKRLSIRN